MFISGAKFKGHCFNISRDILACVASVSVGFGSNRPIFRAGKTPKIPFLGLSLLANSTETLATQARDIPD